jgi:hypothetical protein
MAMTSPQLSQRLQFSCTSNPRAINKSLPAAEVASIVNERCGTDCQSL